MVVALMLLPFNLGFLKGKPSVKNPEEEKDPSMFTGMINCFPITDVSEGFAYFLDSWSMLLTILLEVWVKFRFAEKNRNETILNVLYARVKLLLNSCFNEGLPVLTCKGLE
jgi:hypothetical protein